MALVKCLVSLLALIVVALLALVAVNFDNYKVKQFKEFVITFNKTYADPIETAKALIQFSKNLDIIDAHNARYAAGLESYKMGANRFADQDPDDVVKKLCGRLPNPKSRSHPAFYQSIDYGRALPARFDSSHHTGDVADQGNCGSCWAFAAVAHLQTQHYLMAMRNGVDMRTYDQRYNELSQQQLVDCTSEYYGCNGGLEYAAYNYVMKNGIFRNQDYPYNAKKGICMAGGYRAEYVKPNICEVKNVPARNETILQHYLYNVGSLTIGVDARGFAYYESGIYYEPQCSSNRLGHSVLLVGWGSENGQDYWIIRNSWGPYWGERGNIRIARNRDNHCGVASDPSYARLCDEYERRYDRDYY